MSTKFTLWIIDDKWMIVWFYDCMIVWFYDFMIYDCMIVWFYAAYQDKNTCRVKLGTQIFYS